MKPAPERALAAELAALAGGPGVLADRALELLAVATDAPDSESEAAERALRLAGHLAEHAWLADPADEGVQRARQRGLRRPGRPGHLDHGPGRLHLGRQRVGGAAAAPHPH